MRPAAHTTPDIGKERDEAGTGRRCNARAHRPYVGRCALFIEGRAGFGPPASLRVVALSDQIVHARPHASSAPDCWNFDDAIVRLKRRYAVERTFQLEDRMDTVLISESEGVRRLDRRIFDRALQTLGAQPGEARYVGDHPDVDTTPFAGAAAPALAIGYCLGRIGCFLVGDDYGRPTNSWVGIAFPKGSPPTTAEELRNFGAKVDPSLPPDAILRVHPTQIYESAAALPRVGLATPIDSRLRLAVMGG